MKMDNFKIGPRLIASFSLVLIMLVTVAALGVSRLAAVQRSMTVITKGNDVEANLASDMRLSLDERMIALRNIVLLTDRAQMLAQVDQIRASTKAYQDAEQGLRATFAEYGMQDEEARIMDDLKTQAAAAAPLLEKIESLGLANQNAEALQLLLGDMRTVQRRWHAALKALVDCENRQNREAMEAADAAYATARNLMVGISAAAALVGIGIAVLITRSITGPIRRAVRLARTVADGDLSSAIEVHGKDETAMLLAALKGMNDNLRVIVGQVRQGSDTMRTASEEIAGVL